ncbi:MAG: hypothetical protein RH862_03420 [Leptospiraceae bacterium]
MERSIYSLFLIILTLSFCQPEPAELQKRWKAHSVEIRNGADAEFARVIQKEAYLDLRVPFNFYGRIPESDGMSAHHNRMSSVAGVSSIELNDTIDKLELNLTYAKPPSLKGEEQRFALHNPSAESITITFVINETSGDGSYSVTFQPVNSGAN